MKRFFTFTMTVVLASLLGAISINAASLTVFDGNQVSPYVPLPTASYGESGTRGQVIYPASALEDMIGQPINGFTLYINDEGCKMNGGTLRISAGIADTTVFTSEAYLTGLTRVALVEMKSGLTVMDIDFDEPFLYNGGNLVLDFYVQSSGEDLSAYEFTYFYGLFQTGHSSLSGGEYREFIPKTTFYYGELEPVAARVNPRSIAFEPVRVGESQQQVVSLRNTGANAFTPSVSIAQPFAATMSQASLQPGETMEITVAFEPTAAGVYQETMVIVCGDGCTLEVPVTGEGLENGTELVVADGPATNQYLPFNGIYADDVTTLGQMIYPASMLTDMQGGKLVALSFFTSSKINMRNVVLELSLLNTDQEAFDQATPIDGMTAVATANVIQGETMVTFEFDQPFEYTGKNLAVQVKVAGAGWTSTTYFNGVSTEDYTGLSCYKSWSGEKKDRYQFLPKAAFLYQAAPAGLRGDVDMDGQVGIADVTALIDYILNSDATGIDVNAADCDSDGNIGIADVTALIDYILHHAW